MRFMQITATVRLKNFEHIVDLIEADGGNLEKSHYIGNGRGKNIAPKRRSTKPITRTRITPEIVQSVKNWRKHNPKMPIQAIAEKTGISMSSVRRIVEGRRG